MLADRHPDHAKRLSALHALDILDSEAERDFDEIVQLASRICEMPISLISLVDEDRQWFKARVGLDDTETDLSRSICSHAILQDEVFEVEDTLADPRTADNPLCSGSPHLRFYAGAPLITSDGLPLGSLCVLDDKPRRLNDLQRDALTVLARQVVRQMELRKALRDREILQKEMDHRVKNSLQNVASILRLSSRGISDPIALDALQTIRRRIEAIGALHTELQYSAGDRRVDVAAFLKRIAGLLEVSLPAGVSLDLSADHAAISSEKVSALGIIVSEFLANSIKHGFPDGREGQIRVGFSVNGDGAMRLDCHDNGVGAVKLDGASSSGAGLGQSLIAAAASQVEGELETFLDYTGSRLTLTF